MIAPYYTDGSVTLYHGDAMEITDWLKADVLVTDPPYGINYVPRGSYNPRTGKTAVANLSAVRGDKDAHLRDAALALWGDRPSIVFGSWRIKRPPGVTHRLIWHKAGMPPGPAHAAFLTQDEEIYVIGSGWRKSSPPLRSVITTHELRQNPNGAAARIGHPTPKPLGLMEELVGRCPPGTIADPFAGSGSTLVAAKALGLKSIGVELEEKYCEIAACRLAQYVLDFGAPA